MKDKSVIFLIVLCALVLGYFIFFYAPIDFEVSEEIISVNIYDNVNLKNYISKARGVNNKNLKDTVKITVNMGEKDSFENDKLFIGDFSNKTVTYTLKYKFKTVKKTMSIVVISDPTDPNYRINNYQGTDVNNDDIPNNQINNNLNNNQKSYIDSLLK